MMITTSICQNDHLVTAANSVFIKLWGDVKHSTLNRYFAFVELKLTFFSCHNFIDTLTLAVITGYIIIIKWTKRKIIFQTCFSIQQKVFMTLLLTVLIM